MKILRISALAAAALLMCETGGKLMAQGGIQPLNQPAYSPYLNLFRSGTPFYQNYYGLVLPEQQFRNAFGQLQQGQGAPDQAYAPGPANQYVTGHPAVFLNTEGYFPGNSGTSQGGGVGGIRPNIGASSQYNFSNYGNLGNSSQLGSYGPGNYNFNYGNSNYNYTTPRPNNFGIPGINY